jgi:Zn-dependent M28 family amino/carboxypeptidase
MLKISGISGWIVANAVTCLVSAGAFAASPESIVAVLSGRDEIEAGRRLADRSTSDNRRLVRGYLAQLFTAAGLSPVRHAYQADGENIYAVLPATLATSEIIILGAHFDSVRRSPGANDNATGVALVQAVGEAMAQLRCRSRALSLVYFDQEENGLVGSRAFAVKMQGEESEVHSVHTIDQMGWDRDGDRAIELELPPAQLFALYERHAEQMGITVHSTRTPSSDHSSFRDLGFDALGITEEYVNGDTTPHYHRSTDTFDTVNFDYLRSTTELMKAVFTELLTEGCEP